MCDAVIRSKVDEVIGQWVKDGKAFTAYDVTVEVRKQLGRAVNVPHNEVREAVRCCSRLNDLLVGEYDDDNNEVFWYKTLIVVGQDENGGDLKAFLYHDEDYEPSDYKPQSRPQVKTTVTTVDVVTSSPTPGPVPTPALAPPVADGFFHVDDRNRLLVPTNFFKAIGADPQSQVNVVFDGDKVYIVNTQLPVGQRAQQQIVERDGIAAKYAASAVGI